MKKTMTILLATLFSLNCISQNTDKELINAHFMVFSDPHYYDPSLGTEGSAFQQYLDQDRKLLKESRELIHEAIEIISGTEASFVIIPGDLTKDGTLISHTEFAKLISEIENLGKPVYVVPGNHDISNGESNSYIGDEVITVENVSPEEFKSIYGRFGYDEAIHSDTASLSYVVEPAKGLWLLGLDACLYKNNLPGHHPNTDGAFSPETMDWIESIAELADKNGKKMIAFMHHGVLEHYKGQERFYGEYIVDDYKKVSKRFAELGINLVFTGHYHAQDITMQQWKNGDFIFDIQTGSLVTYPTPVREILIQNSLMKVQSHFIEKTTGHPENFTAFSREYVHSGIAGIAENTLISYKLKPEDANRLSGQIADAFVAHYQGDEVVPDKYLDVSGINLWGRIIILVKRKLIVGLYNDLIPEDNHVVIDLENGAWGDQTGRIQPVN
jgi:predicted phosphodiesterase